MPDDPIPNPDVRPARWWEWSGWWSFLLLVLEWAQGEVGGWKDPPRWVGIVLVALPFVIRFVREKVTGVATSFRRTA